MNDLIPFSGDLFPSTRSFAKSFFDRFFSDDLFSAPTLRGTPGFYPAIDISETETDVIVHAELPGLSSEDISVNVTDGTLTIQGEKKTEKSGESSECFKWVERSYGSFVRSFHLPATTDPTNITADFKKGVLTVKIPKKEPAKANKIQIKSED